MKKAEEERRRREEEEERRQREEEEMRLRMEVEEEKRKAQEEELRRREEEEATSKALEAKAALEAKEVKQTAKEPQTREDPDIELVTEEMLDDSLLDQEPQARGEDDGDVASSFHTQEEQGKDEDEEEDEWLPQAEKRDCEHLPLQSGLETNGTLAEAGPQFDEKEDTQHGLSSIGVSSNLPPPTSDLEQTSSTTSTTSHSQHKLVGPVAKTQVSKSQEKREQRRRRGLEHNQRETLRAASTSTSSSATSAEQTSPPKSKTSDVSKQREGADSKELDQYTFVAWKMKEEKGGKKDTKISSQSGAVRPTTLSLHPAESTHEKTVADGGALSLMRSQGPVKEKWKGKTSDGEHSPQHNMYVSCNGYILMFCAPFTMQHVYKSINYLHAIFRLEFFYLQKSNGLLLI